MEVRSIVAAGPGTVGTGHVRRAVAHPRRGIAGGLVATAAVAWAVAAPLLFGADEAADWGWHATTLAAGPGCAAVLGGLLMATARPREVRAGGLLLLAAGPGLGVGGARGRAAGPAPRCVRASPSASASPSAMVYGCWSGSASSAWPAC